LATKDVSAVRLPPLAGTSRVTLLTLSLQYQLIRKTNGKTRKKKANNSDITQQEFSTTIGLHAKKC